MSDSIKEFEDAMDVIIKNINIADLYIYDDETPIHQMIKAIQCAEDVKELYEELEEHNNLLEVFVRKKIINLGKMDLWRICCEVKKGGLDISSDELLSKAEHNNFSVEEMAFISRILSKYE